MILQGPFSDSNHLETDVGSTPVALSKTSLGLRLLRNPRRCQRLVQWGQREGKESHLAGVAIYRDEITGTRHRLESHLAIRIMEMDIVILDDRRQRLQLRPSVNGDHGVKVAVFGRNLHRAILSRFEDIPNGMPLPQLVVVRFARLARGAKVGTVHLREFHGDGRGVREVVIGVHGIGIKLLQLDQKLPSTGSHAVIDPIYSENVLNPLGGFERPCAPAKSAHFPHLQALNLTGQRRWKIIPATPDAAVAAPHRG